MPINLNDAAREVIRDAGFQALPSHEQMRVLESWIAQQAPQRYEAASPIGRAVATADLLARHNPGTTERIASYLPVVGPVVEAARSRAGTYRAIRSIPGVADDPFSRALLTFGAEALMLYSGLKVGSAVARRVVPRLIGEEALAAFGARGVGEAARAAATRTVLERAGVAAGGTAAAETVASQAGLQAFRSRIASRVIEDFTAGEVLSLGTALLRGEIHPMQDLLVNPTLGVGLGLAIGLGYPALVRRFGNRATAEAAELLSSPRGERLRSVAGGAQRVVNTYSRQVGGSRGDAAQALFDLALDGQASTEVQRGVMSVLRTNPELLQEDFALQLVRRLQPAWLGEAVRTSTRPGIRLTVEDAVTRRESVLDLRSTEELGDVLKRVEAGELQILSAEAPESAQAALLVAIEHGGLSEGPAPRAPRKPPSPGAPRAPRGAPSPGAAAIAEVNEAVKAAQHEGARLTRERRAAQAAPSVLRPEAQAAQADQVASIRELQESIGPTQVEQAMDDMFRPAQEADLGGFPGAPRSGLELEAPRVVAPARSSMSPSQLAPGDSLPGGTVVDVEPARIHAVDAQGSPVALQPTLSGRPSITLTSQVGEEFIPTRQQLKAFQAGQAALARGELSQERIDWRAIRRAAAATPPAAVAPIARNSVLQEMVGGKPKGAPLLVLESGPETSRVVRAGRVAEMPTATLASGKWQVNPLAGQQLGPLLEQVATLSPRNRSYLPALFEVQRRLGELGVGFRGRAQLQAAVQGLGVERLAGKGEQQLLALVARAAGYIRRGGAWCLKGS